MKNKFQFLSILFLLFIGLAACEDKDGDGDGKNNNPCSTAWAISTSAESQAVSSAALAYGSDQSQENCQAYKNAFQDYLNALKEFEDCSELSTQDRQSLQSSIAQAQSGLNGLDCSQQN